MCVGLEVFTVLCSTMRYYAVLQTVRFKHTHTSEKEFMNSFSFIPFPFASHVQLVSMSRRVQMMPVSCRVQLMPVKGGG